MRATEIGPATFRPQQRGLEHDLADLNCLVGKRSSRVAGRVKLKIQTTNTSAEGIRWGPSSPPSLRSAVDQLDQLPADEERAAGRAGVAWATHPAAKGSRCWPGRGAPEPFASFFQGSDCSLSERRALSREAPSGLRRAPAGPRVVCGAEERTGAPPRSTRRGFSMLRSSLNRSLESSLAAGTPRFSAIPSAPGDLIRALRLCSDRGHPGGQESGRA